MGTVSGLCSIKYLLSLRYQAFDSYARQVLGKRNKLMKLHPRSPNTTSTDFNLEPVSKLVYNVRRY